LAAFGAGILSFLSPCVLPLAPAYLCFLGGVGLEHIEGAPDEPHRGPDWRLVALALAFVLGFGTVFVALGATASTVGDLVSRYFDELAVAGGLVISALGLHFLGVLRIPILLREARFRTAANPAGLAGAYVVGLAFAFGWTPCVGPALAAILLVAGAEATAARGALLLAAYALGLGVPFVLAAVFAGPFLEHSHRLRAHLKTAERIMGGALVLTGLLFITGAMPKIGDWLLRAFPALGGIG
jgi:cytochrome c-type biogenesis protein